MAVKPEVLEFINLNAEKIASEAKSIIDTITNKETTIEFSGAEEYNFENVSGIYEEEIVNISFKLKTDDESKFYLLMPKSVAALIGSLMMMMEEEDPEFNEEEHLDAMKETVSQILGALSTNLKDIIEADIGFEEIEGSVTAVTEDLFVEENLVAGKYNLSIAEGEAQTITAIFTSDTVDKLMAGGEEEEEESFDGEISLEELAGLEEEVGVENFEIEGVLGEQEDLSADAGEDIFGGGEQPQMAPTPMGGAQHGAMTDASHLEFLFDLTFPISIELGRTKMLIKDILDLGHGSVIEFDKLAGDPVDLLIDDKKIAEGEVVVIDERFGIKITNLVQEAERLKEIKKKL